MVPVEVDPDHSVIGPEFRDRAGDVVAALETMDPAEVKAQLDTSGEVTLDVGADGEAQQVVLPAEAVDVIEEQRAASGEEVAVVEIEGATALVYEGE
jgi:valyl-tRNA synthetase